MRELFALPKETSSPTPVAAVDYYVGSTGSDSNGGAATTPFLTITKALTTVVSGDTVHVGGGTFSEVITPLKPDSASNSAKSYR